MSFKALTAAYAPKRKAFTIEHDGKKLEFTATEVPHLIFDEISAKRQTGDNWLVDLVMNSIIDSEGKRMTRQQAESLPDEYANIFLSAALDVNRPADKEAEGN